MLFLPIAIAVFLALDVIALTQLARIHPSRRRWLAAVAVICNAMWIFLPWLNARTDFSRLTRALFGPPWFAWLCFLIVYNAVLLLIVIAWLPFHRRRPFREFARWPSRIFLWTTLVALVAGVYTALVPLDVRRVPVFLHGLPPQMDGTKIVMLADLHTGLFTRSSRLREIFQTVNGIRPDLVLLVGDSIDDDPVFVPKLLRGASWLRSDTPLLAVLGNHEMYGNPYEVIAELRGSRVHLLVNQGMQWRGLWIAGLSDYAARTPALAPNFDAALRGEPPGTFPIIVAHQPRAFPETIRRGLPLALVAHTHGGQFGFRPLHWSLAGLFLPYHMGLYRRGNSQLYVNTGTGFWLLPWRLGLPGEITVIELRRL